MDRRDFLATSSVGLIATQLPFIEPTRAAERKENAAPSGEWKARTIKLHAKPSASVRGLVIPLPMQDDKTYQRSLGHKIKGNFDSAEVVRDSVYRADALFVSFPKSEKAPEVEVQMSVETRNRSWAEPLSPTEDLQTYLKPTPHMPIDGPVKELAQKISKQAKTSDEKARAFHNWIVENTVRDPEVKGCGLGDIGSLVKSKTFSGKCADLNALFVGFCRAAGVPAREVYGLRVGDSQYFKSLGKSGSISKAQHCRAEYYTAGKGWIAVDPADVRKAILEEKLDLKDPRIAETRRRLFGSWEMNWIAYNTARDFELSVYDKEINYLMYPLSVGGTLDSLSPDQFNYSIETVEAASS